MILFSAEPLSSHWGAQWREYSCSASTRTQQARRARRKWVVIVFCYFRSHLSCSSFVLRTWLRKWSRKQSTTRQSYTAAVNRPWLLSACSAVVPLSLLPESRWLRLPHPCRRCAI
ncbi:unnamed protein product [Ectocarpus sp. 13 AM-2016]